MKSMSIIYFTVAGVQLLDFGFILPNIDYIWRVAMITGGLVCLYIAVNIAFEFKEVGWMKKKMIEIGYARKGEYDFGLLAKSYRLGIIKVEEKVWADYVKKRMDFEFIHHDLVDLARKKQGFLVRRWKDEN